jgi:endonuclease G
LLVLGGALWGKTKAARKNDYFVGSHNIRTPESFRKAVIAGDGSTLARLIPNDRNATRANLDTFLIKPAQLEVKAKVKLPEVPKAWRFKKPRGVERYQ